MTKQGLQPELLQDSLQKDQKKKPLLLAQQNMISDRPFLPLVHLSQTNWKNIFGLHIPALSGLQECQVLVLSPVQHTS